MEVQYSQSVALCLAFAYHGKVFRKIVPFSKGSCANGYEVDKTMQMQFATLFRANAESELNGRRHTVKLSQYRIDKMSYQDIRWQQRFQNYLKAFLLLEQAVIQYQNEGMSDLEEQGLIQRFEFTHELAWNVLKDYFEYQGNSTITGSRDAVREAFHKGLIADGEGWMDMIKSRNKSLHTYNQEIANEIVHNVVEYYYVLFLNFKERMNQLKDH